MALFSTSIKQSPVGENVNKPALAQVTESIILNVASITDGNCILYLEDSLGNNVMQFDLSETTQSFTSLTFKIQDSKNTALINILDLPNINVNAGSYANFKQLWIYLDGLLVSCECPCGDGSETTATMGALIDSAIEKNPLIDADMFAIRDSVSGLLQKFSWLNLKSKFIDGILAGYVSGAGVISAADTIKTAIQKLNGNIVDKRTFSRTTVGDANYSVLSTDDYVTTSVAFTAPRVWALPNTILAGEEVIISDDLQTITSLNTLTISVQIGKSLNGVINGTEVMNAAGSWRRLCCDGAGNYFFDKGIARLGKTQTFTGINTFSNAIVADSETANTIAFFDGSKNLKSLPLITFPSINELAFVKGVTSSIQTQIDGKQATLVSGTNIRPINNNSLLGASNLRILGAVCGLISATTGAGATLYYSLIGTAAGVVIGSIAARQIPFSANTFQNLSILTSTSQPATGSQVVTIFNNSTATIITLTIASGSAAGTFSDRVNSFNTVNDDKLTIQVINNAATNGATIVSYSINLY